MHHIYNVLICFFVWAIVCTGIISGQEKEFDRTFKVGAILGLNASQVDGDELAGFNRLGITGGIHGGFAIAEKLDMNIELLYSERGSRPDLFNPLFDPNVNISLKYIEIPVYVRLLDWYDEDYYKVKVHAGLSYGRLLSASTFDGFSQDSFNLDDFADDFNKTDLSWIVGGSIFFSRHWGATIRYTRFINNLFDPSKVGVNARKLRSYFITFRLEYAF